MKTANQTPKNPHALPVPSSRWADGMTLRDYFANSVLQSKMSTVVIGYLSAKDIAEHCYQVADAMLEERENN